VADAKVVWQGWGSTTQAYGAGAFGQGIANDFGATTSVGSVSVSTGCTVSVTGLVGTSAVGTVTTSVSETIYVTGVEATTYVGNVLVWSRSAPASTSWSDAGAATSEWTDADPATTEWEKIA
jgi:hypothetical protein